MSHQVIWNNLSMSPWMRKIRTLISWAITIALIIFWGPIVAFVGVISNINTLANTVSFLSWINSIPPAVQGIIQGILPPVALAVLFIVLPIFLRACIQLQGEPLQSEIERRLWARFWVFQVVHGFLIITIASGLPSALQNIQARINQLPTLLANNLPSASIFFLTFVLTTTLSSAGSMNARLVPWVLSKITFLRGNTPRKVNIHSSYLRALPNLCPSRCTTSSTRWRRFSFQRLGRPSPYSDASPSSTQSSSPLSSGVPSWGFYFFMWRTSTTCSG